ncbi:MAG: substrate-binding domain-containing protein, partial [Spirochaetaceae bacterium]|nr:substrate-binding domain-containing protein [Spirochaetaceae bacterium]
ACAEQAKTESVRFLVGFSQANLTEPWRIAMTEEIKTEAARYQDMRVIYADAADSTSRQIADVHRLMDYGIDLLIISPMDSHALTPEVREIYSRIPVIVLDRAVEGYDYSLFIGPDNERLGREAGRVIAELLGERDGAVLEIQGRSGSPPTLGRSQGIREVLAKRPNIKIVDSIVADWLRDTAEDKVLEHIRVIPKIDVIFAQNDAMALGAWRAARIAGRMDIKFMGIDGLPGPTGGIELVRKGILSATFTCPTGGKESVIYARDLLLRKEGIPKKVFLRPRKVTPELLAEAQRSGAEARDERAPGRPIVLGFAQVGAESEWRVANTKSIKSAAAKAGIKLLFEDGKQRQENQIAAIRSFIERHVDVIAFSPVVESGWDEVLQEAKAAGIPVILSDRAVDLKDDSLWLSFMGSDFVEEGRRAARWLVERAGADAGVDIVELQGTIGSAPAIDRTIGFEEVIKDYPNYRIVASESGDFFRDQGYEVMKSILSRGVGDFRAVFAHNDDMAIGAIQAMEEAGLRPGKDIFVVSIDAANGAFKAMLEGKLSCTVECSPLLGPQLMKAVEDYISGKDLPIRMIMAEGVFPAETARKDMVGREY